jgi:hypothetical protein
MIRRPSNQSGIHSRNNGGGSPDSALPPGEAFTEPPLLSQIARQRLIDLVTQRAHLEAIHGMTFPCGVVLQHPVWLGFIGLVDIALNTQAIALLLRAAPSSVLPIALIVAIGTASISAAAGERIWRPRSDGTFRMPPQDFMLVLALLALLLMYGVLAFVRANYISGAGDPAAETSDTLLGGIEPDVIFALFFTANLLVLGAGICISRARYRYPRELEQITLESNVAEREYGRASQEEQENAETRTRQAATAAAARDRWTRLH